VERFELENRLHRALENREFSLQYQPQINLQAGEIIGMEALLRWTPEGHGPVPPSVFIPLLEESGLILAVGEWVLWQACNQCVQWQRAGLPPLRISVNISALQFMRGDLELTVRKILAATGLDPRLLCLELTESMVMNDSDRAIATMEALTGTGALLSLDDFGTGYSSLAYLGRLPINELKIDQSFVKRMLITRNDAAVVNTIIAMGQGLEMKLIAEGVETEEQLTYLLGKNCTSVQGYLFSEPLSAEQCERFIREWQVPAPLPAGVSGGA
jgi:EAL domain-containing protein (putative c-di-GMP-specific phosphodiesterase class I)